MADLPNESPPSRLTSPVFWALTLMVAALLLWPYAWQYLAARGPLREARVEELRRQNQKGKPDFVLDVAFAIGPGDTVRTAVPSTSWLSEQLRPGDAVPVQYPASRPALASLAGTRPDPFKLYIPAGLLLLHLFSSFRRGSSSLRQQPLGAAALALIGLGAAAASLPLFWAEGRRQAEFGAYTYGQRADLQLLSLDYPRPGGVPTATFRMPSDGYVPATTLTLRQPLYAEEYAYLLARLRRGEVVRLRQEAWFSDFAAERAGWQRHGPARQAASWGYWPAVLLLLGGAGLLAWGLSRSWDLWRPAEADFD
ncbi:hypothetical protein EJV47_10005 [Hymenobacter gummosus]|uniref:DUF3592 domain-containing protein n=1 Tax=Hymenobacter gummosus TaxID=1776032 RepID=A0A3S0K6Q4_9BACT|nr:hypothetical protein [Hymenobacter gummosus]RTQ50937.1 hypothetical protein EJV47_10005 [Hymenobacter gummosus]